MASGIGAAGATQILQRVLDNKPGQFKIKTGGAQNVRATLDQMEAKVGRQQIISGALLRLQGIQQGIIAPDSEWETVGGFLQSTGQPFTLEFDERGRLQTIAQTESDLPGKTPVQQAAIREAIDRMQELVEEIDLEGTKAGLRAELSEGILRIEEIKNFSPPEEFWERQFQTLSEAGRPVKLVLDAEGNRVALDQLEHDFSDVTDPTERLTLLNAQRDLKAILSGTKTATEAWELEALGNSISGDDFFLALDENGDVDVLRNKLATVTPTFLEADDDAGTGTAAWEEDALAFYVAGKGFHFDALPDGTIRAVENTVPSLTRQNEIEIGKANIQAALVSLLA